MAMVTNWLAAPEIAQVSAKKHYRQEAGPGHDYQGDHDDHRKSLKSKH